MKLALVKITLKGHYFHGKKAIVNLVPRGEFHETSLSDDSENYPAFLLKRDEFKIIKNIIPPTEAAGSEKGEDEKGDKEALLEVESRLEGVAEIAIESLKTALIDCGFTPQQAASMAASEYMLCALKHSLEMINELIVESRLERGGVGGVAESETGKRTLKQLHQAIASAIDKGAA